MVTPFALALDAFKASFRHLLPIARENIVLVLFILVFNLISSYYAVGVTAESGKPFEKLASAVASLSFLFMLAPILRHYFNRDTISAGKLAGCSVLGGIIAGLGTVAIVLPVLVLTYFIVRAVGLDKGMTIIIACVLGIPLLVYYYIRVLLPLYLAMVPVLAFERIGAYAAIKRSMALADSKRFYLFKIGLSYGVLSLPVMLIAVVAGFAGGMLEGVSLPVSVLVVAIGVTLTQFAQITFLTITQGKTYQALLPEG